MSGLPHKAWVLVADGEKALFLRNVTDEEDPFLQVIRKEEQDNPKDTEQSANRPGRVSDNGPGQRSVLDDTDWHELAKERFAADLAQMLYERVHRGAFEHIALIAPPKTLGELRQALHKEVSDRVIAEVPKTLTNHPIEEIERQLRNGLIAA